MKVNSLFSLHFSIKKMINKFGFINLSNGFQMPKYGFGCYLIGSKGTQAKDEIESIHIALKGGVAMYDTAEWYGHGESESFLANALKGHKREDVFIVSKVSPNNAGRHHMFESCEHSLKCLQTDYIDLYLLHWRGSIPLRETVECMEELVQKGWIKMWGVSNFDVSDMEELWSLPNGNHCVVNQVKYHLGTRGIEYDLIPWMREHKVALMAYSPLSAGHQIKKFMNNKVLQEIAKKHNCTIPQILLRFTMNTDIVAPIPKSSNPKHTQENLESFNLQLSDEEWKAIDKEFPPPTHKVPLDLF